MSPCLRRLLVACLAGFLPTLGGCAALLTEALVSSPHRLNPLLGSVEDLSGPRQLLGIRQRFFVPVDDPTPANIAVSIIEPANSLAEPAGTVLVIHGIRAQGLWMRSIGSQFARAGYRVALVDLRGHGSSTGNTLSYGVHEARDLSAVVDELSARGLLAGKLGVFGHSYGATTSIHLAAIDTRVAAVVATAPFADIRDEVPHYVRTMLPGVGHVLSDETYDNIVAAAGRRGKFDPAEARAEVAIRQVTAPVLLMHGLDDVVIPYTHSERIHKAAPNITELELLPKTGHFGIWLDEHVAKRAVTWFDDHLRSHDGGLSPAREQINNLPGHADHDHQYQRSGQRDEQKQ